MARRGRSRIPGPARLASGVVMAGVVLGLLLATMIDPVMKQPEGAVRQPLGLSASVAAPPEVSWDAGYARVPDSFRPDLDYDAVVGEEWALPDSGGTDAAPIPSFEEATEAADGAAAAAAAALEASAPQALPEEQAGSPARKSALAQGGFY